MPRVVPKYFEIEHALRRQIASLTVGDRLPPEPELAEEFGVSRTTLRIALSTLVDEGVLERLQGKGTFVASGKLDFPLSYNNATRLLDETLITHEVMSVRTHAADTRYASLFDIDVGQPITSVQRSAFFGKIPIGTGNLVVPVSVAPGLANCDLSKGRFFHILSDIGVSFPRYRLTVDSTFFGSEESRMLGIRPGLPAIELTRHGLDYEDRIIVEVKVTTRSDLARYSVILPTSGYPVDAREVDQDGWLLH